MCRWRVTRAGVCVVLLAVCAGLSEAANAQQTPPPPSRVEPPSIPAAPATPTRIVLPRVEAGAAIPKGADALFFVLTAFHVEGEFAELAAPRRELEARLVGKRISVAQLFEFAGALQALYVRAGYPLVRVVVTPQELGASASVSIRVVDGFVERIDASAINALARPRVLAVVGSLVGQRRLTQAELERRLLIAGESPGLVLNATFAGGKEIGGSVLILTGRYRPVSVSVYGDNSMPQVFGSWQEVTTASVNGVLGFGEQFTVTAAGFPDRNYFYGYPTRRYLGASATVPLGVDGLLFEVGGTLGTTTPQVDPTAASQGHLSEGYFGLAYDLVKRREASLTLDGRFDATNQQMDSLLFDPAQPLNADRLRVLRGGAEGVWSLPTYGASFAYGATLSQGLDVLGARMASDASSLVPLSRAGANAVFTKLNGHASLTDTLPSGVVATLSLSAQTGFGRPLLTPEQFDVSGAQALSGYSTGSLVGDSGWVVRQEFGRSFAAQNAPAVITPYLFGATGEVVLEEPTALEQGVTHASNLGAGARFNFAAGGEAPDFSCFVEGSRQFSDAPGQDGWRLFVGGVWRY